MTNKNFTHICVDRKTKDTIQRIAQIKRWTIAEFLRFISELFTNGLDLMADPTISIEELREFYGNWQLALYASGRDYYG